MTEDILPPRENPDLFGHEAAEGALKKTFDSGRVAHAWLISGPKGIGKATLAYRFARYVLASGGGEEDKSAGLFGNDLLPPDGPINADDTLYISPGHPVFRRMAAGGHADFMSVERSLDDKGKLRSEIVVSDVRAIGRFFNLTAGEGGWRVVVIDCADDMNPNAANALLKVLEEPPEKGLLLLVSHNPGRLLPTIRSRCSKLALKPLPEDTVQTLIQAHLPELDAGGDALALAHLADGSPGRALALAQEGGLEIYRDMTGLLETMPKLDVAALHAFGSKLGRAGTEEKFRTAGGLLRWWLARLIVVAAGGSEAIPRFTASEEALMGRLGAAAGLDRWLEVWEKINHLLTKTDHVHLDRKQVVLNVFLAIENAVRS
ncbi:MAG: DNA polymerase III subunit delta' [Rhodospirillales bacterium]|nr:DNA polymerase III subunit delta' [Rhodospirillales bacterium]